MQSFIDEYNCEAINYSLKKYDLNKFERINLTIALHALYAMKEKKYPSCVSKLNSACEKQMYYQNDFKRRRMALYCKKSIRRANIKNVGHFHYLIYLHYLRTKTKIYS